MMAVRAIGKWTIAGWRGSGSIESH